MITEPFKIEENGLTIEANWRDKVKPCKKFKFTIDSKCTIIDYDFLYQLLVIFSQDKELDKLVRKTDEEIVSTRRQLKIKANKDIKKGEMITVSVDFPVPKSTFDKIKKFSLKNSSFKGG